MFCQRQWRRVFWDTSIALDIRPTIQQRESIQQIRKLHRWTQSLRNAEKPDMRESRTFIWCAFSVIYLAFRWNWLTLLSASCWPKSMWYLRYFPFLYFAVMCWRRCSLLAFALRLSLGGIFAPQNWLALPLPSSRKTWQCKMRSDIIQKENGTTATANYQYNSQM